MTESIMLGILCLTGAGTIFYFLLKAEEFIMKKITGKGIIESVHEILNEMFKTS